MELTYKDGPHAYYVDGTRCRSVTAVAKVPDDTYHLNRWSERQVAIGLARSPHLLESVAAHHTDKGRLNDLCEQAKVAAGTTVKTEIGSTAHRVTERLDKGEEIIETDLSRKIADVWQGALRRHNLDIVPDLCERTIVYPDELIAGQFDRVLRRNDGSLVMADLKTGQNAVEYPHAISIQLAIYANAPLLAGQWEGKDGSTEEFDPLPVELDRSRGVIIWMPDPDTCRLYEINLVAGYKCFRDVILPTLAWRKRTRLVRPLV